MNDLKPYPNMIQSLGITGIIFLSMIVMNPVNIFFSPIWGKELTMLITYLLSVGISCILILFLRKMQSGIRGFSYGMPRLDILFLTLIATFFLQLGVSTPLVMLIPMPESIEILFSEMVGEMNIYSLISVIIAAPILEEFIFRGVILDGLLKRYSIQKSIILSSALFGLIHGNPWQFVSAFIMGIFFGWVYAKTKNILFPILMHAFSNFSVVLMTYFLAGDGISVEEGMIEMLGGMNAFIGLCIGVSCLFCGCAYLLKILFKKSTVFHLK